jgi:hypothetical protein
MGGERSMADPVTSSGAPTRRPDRPSDGLLLVGHSWTRAQVAGHMAISPGAVASHPHLLRLEGPLCYDAAYPCLQFDDHGVRLDIAVIGMLARRRVPADEVCNWLVRPNPDLGGASPLTWLDLVGSVMPVLEVLPAPWGPFPGMPRPDDGATDQVASWVRRQEDSGGRQPIEWDEVQARGGGGDASQEVRDLIDSLRTRRD